MASRLRANNTGGTIATALTNSGTSIDFGTAPADFDTLTGGDYYTLVLNRGSTVTPGSDNAFEIVYLTSFTSGDTTGTIARAQEDSTNYPACPHDIGASWDCGPTVQDFASIGGNAVSIQGVGVSTTPPTSNQYLKYDNGTGLWTPATVANSSNATELQGVSIATTGVSNGEVLTVVAGVWSPSSTVDATALAGTDLDITSLASGQYLQYDGTDWVNVDLSVPTNYLPVFTVAGGTSDDYTAAEAAYTAAVAAGGGILWFGPNTYSFGTNGLTLADSNITLMGANAVITVSHNSTTPPITFDGAVNCSVLAGISIKMNTVGGAGAGTSVATTGVLTGTGFASGDVGCVVTGGNLPAGFNPGGNSSIATWVSGTTYALNAVVVGEPRRLLPVCGNSGSWVTDPVGRDPTNWAPASFYIGAYVPTRQRCNSRRPHPTNRAIDPDQWASRSASFTTTRAVPAAPTRRRYLLDQRVQPGHRVRLRQQLPERHLHRQLRSHLWEHQQRLCGQRFLV